MADCLRELNETVLPVAVTRSDFTGACGVCDRDDKVDQFCSGCGWCFHINCYTGHEHSVGSLADDSEIPTNSAIVTVVNGISVSKPLEEEEVKEDFILRLSRFPYQEYISSINRDQTSNFSNECQYFKDVQQGLIAPSLSGKWVAYIHNQWWKNKVYDSEDQVYQDKEFTTEMYRVKLCYIVRVGYELRSKIIL